MARELTRPAFVLALVLATGALIAAAPASAKRDSLYGGLAPRPGPDALYRGPAKAPQLANTGPWKAKPLLVSGASAYRRGEFLYQDFIYDDHGARGSQRDPADPRTGSDTFSAPNGTYTYPRDPAYMENAADLLELRVRALHRKTAFRITLNSLGDPGLVATTIAIGDSAEPRAFPHGAGVSGPAEMFLTVHGEEAELIEAADGSKVGPRPNVSVSRRRNQIDVRVRHRAWDPGREKVRLAGGVGLWDEANGGYLTPEGSSDADTPGGASGLSDPAAFFNAAFRYEEPLPEITDAAGALTDTAWWRDKAQAEGLGAGDISGFHAEVDFAKLERRVSDPMRDEPGGTPASGSFDRILASRLGTDEGAVWDRGCGNADDCLGEISGGLVPYSIYVPPKRPPKRGFGLTLLLHSLAANYNQFAGSRNQSQLGDRGRGSIVITPSGRGPDGWYYGHAGADTFEVWADVARRYRLDPRWTAISGYSMGGYGTYKLAAQHPDLFARANPVVGPPGLGVWAPPAPPTGGTASNSNRMLASVRNIPFLLWNGASDQLVPLPGPTAQAQSFDDLGYRYVFDVFTADHFLLAVHDQYQPVADFLGTAKVERNPHHVSYVVNPTMDFANLGVVADHAYWLSRMRLRDSSGEAPLAEVDAISRGFGRTDPEAQPTRSTSGSLEGGSLGSLAYIERSKEWSQPGSAPKRNRLEITATNLAKLTVHPKRAKLGCGAKLDVVTDGPLRVKLAGCRRVVRFDAG